MQKSDAANPSQINDITCHWSDV